MMAKLKTVKNDANVEDFLNAVDSPTKRVDSFVLLDLFTKVTGEKASLWGTSIVGFGSYHYKSERSTQEGDWPITGFSPRKQSLTIYVMPGFDTFKNELAALGKHTTSVSCLYIKRLSDVDTKVLASIIKKSVAIMHEQYN